MASRPVAASHWGAASPWGAASDWGLAYECSGRAGNRWDPAYRRPPSSLYRPGSAITRSASACMVGMARRVRSSRSWFFGSPAKACLSASPSLGPGSLTARGEAAPLREQERPRRCGQAWRVSTGASTSRRKSRHSCIRAGRRKAPLARRSTVKACNVQPEFSTLHEGRGPTGSRKRGLIGLHAEQSKRSLRKAGLRDHRGRAGA